MITRGEPSHWTDPFVSLGTLSGSKEARFPPTYQNFPVILRVWGNVHRDAVLNRLYKLNVDLEEESRNEQW